MLTIKNAVLKGLVLPLLAAVFLAGCMPPGPRALLRGKKLIEQARYIEAVQQLTLATSLLSTNAQAWNYLGLACHHAGLITNAAQYYQKALTLDPDLVEARFNLGCLWLEQNQFEPAKSQFAIYTSLRKNSAEGWVKLGVAEWQSARSGAIAKRQPELVASDKSFREALRLDPRNPEALNGLGLVQVEFHRPVEAGQCFTQALKQQPDYPPALLNLAVLSQVYLHDPRAALQRYREYLALALKDKEEAPVRAVVRELEEELHPTPGPSLRQGAASDGAGAREAAGRVAASSHSDPSAQPRAHFIQSSTAIASSKSQSPGSKPSSEPISKADEAAAPEPKAGSPVQPENLVIPSSLAGRRYHYRSPSKPKTGDEAAAMRAFAQGFQAQKANHLAQAIQGYRQATQLDPDYYDAYYNLALTATAAGNLQQALGAYEYALAIRPDSPDARYNFALALKRANHLADAVRELEKMLASYPDEPRAHLALGNICAQVLQQPAIARQHYLKVLEIDPHNTQADAIRSWLLANPP
jgi:tetratricopeptide (TPR) repeat protein